MSEFEDTLPPPNEPCFYIALPESLHDLVPVNATKLLREWEYGLDPIEALRVALAKTLGSQRYSIRDRFVVPSFGALTLVRQAYRDPGIVAAVREAKDMRISRDVELLTPVHPREPETRRPWDLVEQGTDELTLSSMPVLYGAAVEAALLWPHSYHARAIRTKMLEARIAAGEGSAAAERLIEALGGPAALKPDPEADS